MFGGEKFAFISGDTGQMGIWEGAYVSGSRTIIKFRPFMLTAGWKVKKIEVQNPNIQHIIKHVARLCDGPGAFDGIKFLTYANNPNKETLLGALKIALLKSNKQLEDRRKSDVVKTSIQVAEQHQREAGSAQMLDTERQKLDMVQRLRQKMPEDIRRDRRYRYPDEEI